MGKEYEYIVRDVGNAVLKDAIDFYKTFGYELEKQEPTGRHIGSPVYNFYIAGVINTGVIRLTLKREKGYKNAAQLDKYLENCEANMEILKRYHIGGFLGMIIPGGVLSLLGFIMLIAALANRKNYTEGTNFSNGLLIASIFVLLTGLILFIIGISNYIVKYAENRKIMNRQQEMENAFYYYLDLARKIEK